MGSIQFSGLSSGMDTGGIIDSLVQVESQRLKPIAESQDNLEKELTAIGRLKSYLSAFSTEAAKISDEKGFFMSKVTSNDEDIITASSTGQVDIGQGSINIEVKALAVNEKTQSTSVADTTTDLNQNGSFSINGKNISVVGSDSLSEIRDKINSTSGIGAVASIIKVTDGDYRLTLTNDEGGTDGTIFGDGNGVLNGLGILSSAQTIDTTSIGYEYEGVALDLAGDVTLNGTTISIAADDTLQTISDKLNTIGGVTSTLSSVAGKYQLDLSGVTTLDSDADNVLGRMGLTTAGKNTLQAGANAQVMVDGSILIERTSNSIDDIVEGLQLDLKKAEIGTSVNIDFSRDYDGIKSKVQNFINSYNTVVNYINDQSKYDEKTKKAGDLKNSRVATRTMTDLRKIVNTNHSDYLPDAYSTLANIGVTTDQKTGILNVNSTKLKDAMTADFDSFIKMFADSESSSNSELNLGMTGDDTASGLYYADPTTHSFYDITGAEDSVTSLPTGLGADNALDKYFNKTDLKMYTWSGAAWDGGTAITSADVTFNNGINIVNDGNGKGIGFDGSASGVIAFTKGYSGLFDSLINSNMLDSENGYFTSEKQRIDRSIESYEKQYEKMEDRMAAYKQRLVIQFSQVEQLMSKMQSQSTGYPTA